MANLKRLCLGDNCSDVPEIKANDFMQTSGNMSDDVVVPAHGRTNVRVYFANIIPSDYVIVAFRQMSIQKTTGDAEGFKNVVIQFFGTADGGKTANLGVYNAGDVSATVKVNVTVLAVKLQ